MGCNHIKMHMEEVKMPFLMLFLSKGNNIVVN